MAKKLSRGELESPINGIVEDFDPRLDRNRLMAIQMMLEGMQKADIARKLNVSRSAIYNWLKEPAVREKLKKEQQEIVESGMKRINIGLSYYIDKLKDLAMHSGDARTQLNALTYLIDRAMGKVPTTAKIQTVQEKKEEVPDDVLDKAIAEIKAEKAEKEDTEKDETA